MASAKFPADHYRTIRVEGWPGSIKLEIGTDLTDKIEVTTPTDTEPKFQPHGLGVLRVQAWAMFAPGAEHVLTVAVPPHMFDQVNLLPSEQRIN